MGILNPLQKQISKPEWRYKSKISSYKCGLSVIGKEILYAESEGYCRGEDISTVENTIDSIIDNYFPSGTPFFFVSDVAEMIPVTH